MCTLALARQYELTPVLALSISIWGCTAHYPFYSAWTFAPFSNCYCEKNKFGYASSCVCARVSSWPKLGQRVRTCSILQGLLRGQWCFPTFLQPLTVKWSHVTDFNQNQWLWVEMTRVLWPNNRRATHFWLEFQNRVPLFFNRFWMEFHLIVGKVQSLLLLSLLSGNFNIFVRFMSR